MFLVALKSQAQKQIGEWTEEYLKQNIALTKIKARVVSPDFYVCEITITDFNKKLPLPEGFGMKGLVFSDNGTGNDLVKGDRVYSSTEQIKFLNGQPKILEKKSIYYDENFQYKPSLDSDNGSQTKIGCKFRKCGCPCRAGYTCRACEWCGWQCWEVYECEFAIF
jgi:hypothetical protein